MSRPEVYESTYVSAIVEMPTNFLNRLVERQLHGIKPSLRGDVRTGGRRWFSKDDLFGIALVYWLFKAGLRAGSGKVRTSVMQDVLDEIVGAPGTTANAAAKIVREIGASHLVVVHQIYPTKGGLDEKLQIRHMDTQEFDIDDPLMRNLYGVDVWIPVHNLFERVDHRISLLNDDSSRGNAQNDLSNERQS